MTLVRNRPYRRTIYNLGYDRFSANTQAMIEFVTGLDHEMHTA